MPHQPLKRQKALITGASSGLGEEIAKALSSAGASVAVNYSRNAQGAQRVVEEIRAAGGEAIPIQADVSDEQQVQAMFAEALRTFGTLHILVNNAGIQSDAHFPEMTLEKWNRVIAVNLTGQFLCAREAAGEFIRRGVVPEISRSAGRIICISSVHEIIPWTGHANYASSKAGVAMLMRTMAQELARYRIRVNSICPGAIKTRINEQDWSTPEAESKLLKLIPYGRVGEPADVGRAAVWLASDESDYVTGASIYVDGGMTLYPGFIYGG